MSEPHYTTYEFALAAFALSDPRVQLIGTRPISANRVEFILSPRAVCESLAALFLSDKATVNPRTYADKSRLLKTALHCARREYAP